MSQASFQSSNGHRASASASSSSSAATEVVAPAKRRAFSAAYKQRILQEADACQQPGQLGALLRREGLYSSHLTRWRRQRAQGVVASSQRGPAADPHKKEVVRLQRQVDQLQAKLDQAETIIEVQKKLCTLLGLPTADSPQADNT